MIGESNYLGKGFFIVIWKPPYVGKKHNNNYKKDFENDVDDTLDQKPCYVMLQQKHQVSNNNYYYY